MSRSVAVKKSELQQLPLIISILILFEMLLLCMDVFSLEAVKIELIFLKNTNSTGNIKSC